MTREDIQLQVRMRVGGALRSDLLSGDGLTILLYCINAAQRWFAHTFRFPAFERLDSSRTTNATDAFVAVPADMYAVKTIYNVTSSIYISPLEGGWEQYERMNVLSGAASTPTHWTRNAENLYFSPRPNAAYNLRIFGLIEPSNIASGAEPTLPAVWHDGLVLKATELVWQTFGEPERAEAVTRGELARFLGTVRQQRTVEQKTRRSRGVRVRHHISDPVLGI